jgi:hypothetical protein
MANPIIEGTQIPIKIPACLSPLNHSISENIKDKNAAKNIKKSVGVNFLNINQNFTKSKLINSINNFKSN